MLKISLSSCSRSNTVYVRLDGSLLTPWLPELARVIEPILTQGTALQLDLSGLRFVDAAGLAAIQELIGRGVKLSDCSAYVATLLAGVNS